MTENIFEKAAENGYRFPTPKGNLPTEDLYGLTKKELNITYKNLKELVKSDEDSLLDEKSSEDVDLDTKIEIVKYLFEKKVAAENAMVDAMAKKEKKQQLLEVLSRKKDAALEEMSPEEIQKMIDEL